MPVKEIQKFKQLSFIRAFIVSRSFDLETHLAGVNVEQLNFNFLDKHYGSMLLKNSDKYGRISIWKWCLMKCQRKLFYPSVAIILATWGRSGYRGKNVPISVHLLLYLFASIFRMFFERILLAQTHSIKRQSVRKLRSSIRSRRRSCQVFYQSHAPLLVRSPQCSVRIDCSAERVVAPGLRIDLRQQVNNFPKAGGLCENSFTAICEPFVNTIGKLKSYANKCSVSRSYKVKDG